MIDRSRTFVALACAAALAVTIVGSTIASAHDDETTAKSGLQMTYKAKKGKFVGAVSSANDKCLGGRTVKLFKARTNKLAGKTTTNDAGRWAIAAKKRSGKYYSTVSAKEILLGTHPAGYGELYEHVLICTRAKSATVAS